MAKETKIGLMMIVVLVCAFSFVLYRKMQDRDLVTADNGNTIETDKSKTHAALPPAKTVSNTVALNGVGNSNEETPGNGVQNGQSEPRRLDNENQRTEWPTETQRQTVDTPANSGALNNGGNPFAGAGADSRQTERGARESTAQNERTNPFAGGAAETGNRGGTAAQNAAFADPNNRANGAAEAGRTNAFGEFTGTKTADNHQHGTATTNEESLHLEGGSQDARLLPRRDDGSTTHRRAEYVDPNNPGTREAGSEAGRETAFGLDPEVERGTNSSKQMQQLEGENGRFASDSADRSRQPYDAGAGRFETRQNTTSGDGSAGAGTWPNRAESNTTVTRNRDSASADERRNAFDNRENRQTVEQASPYGQYGATKTASTERRRETARNAANQWPTKEQRHATPDGGATSYEERPTSTNPADRPTYYTVRPGDNYWTISRKTYGTARYFTALARYNRRRIPDPKKMRPGMKVSTPSVAVLKSRNPDLFPKRRNGTGNGTSSGVVQAGFHRDADGRPLYRVADGDTLSDIAQKHLGRASRWIQVYEMNKSRLRDSKNLTIGTELRLPADASRIRLVRRTRQFR